MSVCPGQGQARLPVLRVKQNAAATGKICAGTDALLRYKWMRHFMRLRFPRTRSMVVLTGLLLAAPAFGQDAPRVKVGEKVPNLAFKDAEGRIQQLHELKD